MSIKQRLLYLSCESTHPQSPTGSAAFFEPIEGSVTEIDPHEGISLQLGP
ncbi:MAG: hypothetical protein CM1200mP3_09890 [Chloroflexota bacterium]|nr:MAG: hypothetical protein CM1200mP3_09890 [Chloroflexota bacterium]